MNQNFHEQSQALTKAADSLDNAQRCLNHLDAAIACWHECDETEQLRMIVEARERLLWSLR
jgi:hypothetical protein